MKARGRRRGQTSPAIRRQARKAGKLGGRTSNKLPAEVLARLGTPPATTKELRVWNAKLLAELVWLGANGKIAAGLASSLRATAGALDRALPTAAPEVADEEEDEAEISGPDLEETSAGGGLRVT